MAKYHRLFLNRALSALACGVLLPTGCVSTKATDSKLFVEHIRIADYKAEPERTANSIYIFSADWCEPCKIAKPIVEREAAAKGDRIVIVDANDFRVMDKLGYKSLPLFRITKIGPPAAEMTYKGWDEKAFIKAYRAF